MKTQIQTNFLTSLKGKLLKGFAASSLLSGILFQDLSAQVVYTFSTCGGAGQFGPNQTMVTNAYASTNLAGLVTVSGQGIQQWVVPGGGQYKIAVYGAQGGSGAGKVGGLGAKMEGDFNLVGGTVLKIIVGQKGGSRPGTGVNDTGAGGGGSFVADASNVPLIVAGGGGGAGLSLPGMPGVIGLDGTNSASSAGTGGINGGGGGAAQLGTAGTQSSPGGMGSSCSYGAGGGGFYTNGGQNCSAAAPLIAGFAFVNGGMGGPADAGRAGVDGGFGGGAGVGHRAAGGGGWSGGGGDGNQDGGGGGGSYNAGTSQNNASGVNAGDGLVVITRMCNVTMSASKNPMCNGETITLSTNAQSNIVWSHDGSTSAQVNVSPSANTTYTVTGMAASGCTTSIVMTVSVNPVPNLSAVVSPSVMCVGKDATITASGANSYTWTSLSITGPVATVNPPASTSYNYSGTNQFGCISTAAVNVDVNTNQLGITSNTSVCQGSSAQLSLSNAVTYTWSTGNNFATTMVTPLTNTTYMASGTDIYNCVLSNMVAVTVNQKPNVIANTNKGSVCKGESVTLTAGGATTYTWNNGLGTSASVNVTLPAETVYNYAVTGSDANGCTNTANVQVTANRCTGIDEAGKETSYLNVYPNPSMGEVTVESGAGHIRSIDVIDLSGRTVMTMDAKGNSTKVNISNLSEGVYYFKVRSTKAIEIIKVVKN